MNASEIYHAVQCITAGQQLGVNFIHPGLTCILAALHIKTGQTPQVQFSPGAQSYADNSGLLSALQGDYLALGRSRSASQDRTWSHLTTLYHHAEIESCNAVINDLLFAQLQALPDKIKSHIANIVGELHDNIASHSFGRGFSAAQYYRGGANASSRLEIAIVDAGRGFLHNVRQVETDITSHGEAIAWSLQKGHTAWRPPTPHPINPLDIPFGENPTQGGQQDHHMGWGLWLLTELVRGTRGQLWIWSGDAAYTLQPDGTESFTATPTTWSGVAIEITLYPDLASRVDLDPLSTRLEQLAEELGL